MLSDCLDGVITPQLSKELTHPHTNRFITITGNIYRNTTMLICFHCRWSWCPNTVLLCHKGNSRTPAVGVIVIPTDAGTMHYQARVKGSETLFPTWFVQIPRVVVNPRTRPCLILYQRVESTHGGA